MAVCDSPVVMCRRGDGPITELSGGIFFLLALSLILKAA